MFKLIATLIFSVLLTACSTQENPPKIDKKVSTEVKEKLSPLEEVSRVCLKGDYEECEGRRYPMCGRYSNFLTQFL